LARCQKLQSATKCELEALAVSNRRAHQALLQKSSWRGLGRLAADGGGGGGGGSSDELS